MNSEMSYDFSAPRIVFGWGRRSELAQLAPRLGRRAFVVCGSRTLQSAGLLDEIADLLRSGGVDSVRLENRKRTIVTKSGAEIPVGRSFEPALRKAGWF